LSKCRHVLGKECDRESRVTPDDDVTVRSTMLRERRDRHSVSAQSGGEGWSL